MKKHFYLFTSLAFFLIFIVFTILVKTVDVAYIYNQTYLGLSTINFKFGNWVLNFGKYDSFKLISDIIFYLALGYSVILGVCGIIQLIKEKSFKKVNKRFYILLGAYVFVVLMYLFFEIVKVNYSPYSYEGHLKASYPSSHVYIGISFLFLNSYTAIKLLNPEKKWLGQLTYAATGLIGLLLVFTRSLSLQHWLSDIIASIILFIATYLLFIYLSHRLVPNKLETRIDEN